MVAQYYQNSKYYNSFEISSFFKTQIDVLFATKDRINNYSTVTCMSY